MALDTAASSAFNNYRRQIFVGFLLREFVENDILKQGRLIVFIPYFSENSSFSNDWKNGYNIKNHKLLSPDYGTVITWSYFYFGTKESFISEEFNLQSYFQIPLAVKNCDSLVVFLEGLFAFTSVSRDLHAKIITCITGRDPEINLHVCLISKGSLYNRLKWLISILPSLLSANSVLHCL